MTMEETSFLVRSNLFGSTTGGYETRPRGAQERGVHNRTWRSQPKKWSQKFQLLILDMVENFWNLCTYKASKLILTFA